MSNDDQMWSDGRSEKPPTALGECKLPVLFIDDDQDLLDTIQRKMRKYCDHWSLKYFDSPTEALTAITELSCALIVTDWNMPKLSGLQLCQKLLKKDKQFTGASFYIILLTGRSDLDYVVRGLNAGADDFLTKPFHFEELVARMGVGERILRAKISLHEENARLEESASRDSLTKIYNRRFGISFLEHEISRVRRSIQDIGILLVDIDHFKQVNDNYGHAAGDEALKTVAQRFQSGLRKYDCVCRWGGEEFLIIFPDISIKEMDLVAERIRCQISDQAVGVTAETTLQITVSGGYVHVSRGDETPYSALVEQCDRALYWAKSHGRNRIVAFASTMLYNENKNE